MCIILGETDKNDDWFERTDGEGGVRRVKNRAWDSCKGFIGNMKDYSLYGMIFTMVLMVFIGMNLYFYRKWAVECRELRAFVSRG